MSEKSRNPNLTVLESVVSPIPPPRKLGEAGTNLWNSIQSEYVVADVGGIELLMQVCLAQDRVEALATCISADGEAIKTKAGLRPHPCLRDELAARSFIVRSLQRLGLLDEPVKAIGRPSRRGVP
jgi:hypothetical protein